MEQRSDRFHVQVDVGDDVVEMRATGEVDIATVGVLRSALWAAPARPLLRLDLSGVRLLSAAGVRALVAAHRRARARGGELVLVDPAPMVARVLHVTGLDRVIPVRAGATAAATGPLAPAPSGSAAAVPVGAATPRAAAAPVAAATPAPLALPPGLLVPLVAERGGASAPLVPAA
nr:STAS domain-containing protein [Micromonospora haikouensis]